MRTVRPRMDMAGYLVSLPERVLRSATALAGGLLREVSDVAIPSAMRRTMLYRTMVESTLRFLIEEVGEVDGAYPSGTTLAEGFLVRRAAGNGIEMVGILAFRASPVWVMAALADLSGTGRHLVREIAESLQAQGLLEPGKRFETMDQMLDGLEKTAGRMAEAINTPPLDVKGLREEWQQIKENAARIPPRNLPSVGDLEAVWREMRSTAEGEGRSVFELSAVMALSAVRGVPGNVVWLSRCAQHAARRTGELLASALLDHYRQAVIDIRSEGYLAYWAREFRPYLGAAARQFSPRRGSLTQRLLKRSRGDSKSGF